jgi:hypothetical protein
MKERRGRGEKRGRVRRGERIEYFASWGISSCTGDWRAVSGFALEGHAGGLKIAARTGFNSDLFL